MIKEKIDTLRYDLDSLVSSSFLLSDNDYIIELTDLNHLAMTLLNYNKLTDDDVNEIIRLITDISFEIKEVREAIKC